MLGLHNLPGMRDVAGGRAVELVAATVGNQTSLDFPVPMRGYRDCRFSFAGVKATIYDYVNRFKKKTDLDCDEHIPNLGLNTLDFNIKFTMHYSFRRSMCSVAALCDETPL